MIDDVKGYVVRGTWDTGPVVCHVPGGFWHDRSPHVFREIEYARSQRGLMLQQGCTDVSIFRVHADGREERLPSYEEALDRLCKLEGALSDAARSPLAVLEAAERRLLEAGGWVEVEPAVWMDPRDHWHGNQGEAVDIARLRMMGERLAAKGGA